jgi:RNA ligase (TIGR02306 family)
MSSLIIEVCKIDKIKKHPDADKLEIVVIKGWENITKIGQFKVDDKVVFIPPDSMIPRQFAEKWGIVNYLSGSPSSTSLRVRSVKLRGEMSYGVVINCEDNSWEIGKDVADFYGITKYEPPIRGLIGDAAPDDIYFTKLSDIENIRNVPETFTEGQTVVITEKLDGCFRYDQKVMLINGEQIFISEIKKGDKVLSFDENKEEFVSSTVDDVIKRKEDGEWIILFFDNGNEIVCTVNHMILTKNRGWVEAQHLNEEDNLVEF